jgi:hypothetical protein
MTKTSDQLKFVPVAKGSAVAWRLVEPGAPIRTGSLTELLGLGTSPVLEECASQPSSAPLWEWPVGRILPMDVPAVTRILGTPRTRAGAAGAGLARTDGPGSLLPVCGRRPLEGSGQAVRLVTPDMYPPPSPISPAQTNVTTGTGGSLLRREPSEADQGWWDSDGLLAARAAIAIGCPWNIPLAARPEQSPGTAQHARSRELLMSASAAVTSSSSTAP